jgi:hypothetical protein
LLVDTLQLQTPDSPFTLLEKIVAWRILNVLRFSSYIAIFVAAVYPQAVIGRESIDNRTCNQIMIPGDDLIEWGGVSSDGNHLTVFLRLELLRPRENIFMWQAQVYNTATCELTRSFDFPETGIPHLDESGNFFTFAANYGSEASERVLYDIRTGTTIQTPYFRAISNDGNSFIITRTYPDQDHVDIRVFRRAAGDVLNLNSVSGSQVTIAKFSPDSNFVALAITEKIIVLARNRLATVGRLELWDLRSGKLAYQKKEIDPSSSLLPFAQDSLTAFFSTQQYADNSYENTHQVNEFLRLSVNDTAVEPLNVVRVDGAKFSDNGRFLATLSRRPVGPINGCAKEMVVWDTATTRRVHELSTDFCTRRPKLLLSNDGNHLAVSGHNNGTKVRLGIWNLISGHYSPSNMTGFSLVSDGRVAIMDYDDNLNFFVTLSRLP